MAAVAVLTICEAVAVAAGGELCFLLKTKNQSTKKMMPRLMRVKSTNKKIANGLLVTHSRPSLAQQPSGLGTETLSDI